MSQLTEIIIAAIGGGVVTQIANFALSKRKEDRVDFNAILKVLQEDNKYLRDLNTRYLNEIEDLKLEVADLKSKLILLESK